MEESLQLCEFASCGYRICRTMVMADDWEVESLRGECLEEHVCRDDQAAV